MAGKKLLHCRLLNLVMNRFLFFAVFVVFPNVLTAQYWPEELQLTPEKSNYEKTSTYADVIAFLDAEVSHSPNIRVFSMGKSLEGKDIPVAVLAKPMVADAQQARGSGKLIVYIQGNIHAGEVDGKEAVLMEIRRILNDPNDPLLDSLIILFAPIYNTDSNDKMAFGRRPSQENSPPEVGIRENSQGLDLNRDGVKAEALETSGLFSVINEWDPQLFVDLHTTNGTWHGWNLTWAPSYYYAGEKATYDFTVSMLKSISDRVVSKYGLGFGPFGDFDVRQGWPITNFYTYNHHPRYLVNQFGLRNRMAILSESFAHEPFEKRIYSTYAFVNEILDYASAHATQIRTINKKAEETTIRKYSEGLKMKKGVRFKMVASEVLNDMPVYEHELTEVDGKVEVVRKPGIVRLDSVNYYGGFQAEVESTMPSGYIIPKSARRVVENLRRHGVLVEEVTTKNSFVGERFLIDKFETAQRRFEGHQMARVTGKFVPGTYRAKKGDFRVDLAQPLGNLVFYFLEPESDDGLLTWNFFDDSIQLQKRDNKPMAYPVFKYYK